MSYKLKLCTECSIGCLTDEDAQKHIKETGHKMDDGREVTPINHERPSREDLDFIKKIMGR